MAGVAEIRMTGQIGLGTKADPRYVPMRAHQILAGPSGFVWKVQAGSGLSGMSGSDGYVDGRGWTRFWIAGLAPVVRAGGSDDFARSAAGRAVAESVFWTPAALLPSPEVVWTPVDADTARATVRHRGYDHVLDLTVAEDGRPVSVLVQRWSRENPQKVWRLQPFGGTIRRTRRFGGYLLATEVEGGNAFGTAAYFPFFKAKVEDVRFP